MGGAMMGMFARLTATPRRQRWIADLVFAAALVALVWICYAPSQKHGPRADDWCFLVDTMPHTGPWDSIAFTYSYNRTRTIAPGDTDLFRPVLFALLAAEHGLFAADLWVYQTIGMYLHLAVCFLLLALLRQLLALSPARPGDEPCDGTPRTPADFLPYAIVAFFALNPAVQELVIWSHLHGYLLFLVFLLGSVTLLLRYASDPGVGSFRSPALWGAWALAFVGAFTYELGQIYAVLAGVTVAVAARPRASRARAITLLALFASIAVTYQGVNRYDLEVHRGQYQPDNAGSAIRENVFTSATVEHSIRYALFTTVQPFCPSILQTQYSGDRLQVMETLWHIGVRRTFGPALVVSTTVLALLTGFTLVGLANLFRRGERVPLLAVLLLGNLFGAYAAVTVLGRMNLRPGPPMLASNCYYTYTAMALGLPLAFAAWQGAFRNSCGLARGSRSVLLTGLLVLTFLGAEQVRKVNLEIAQSVRDITRPVHAINLFVKEHRHEPDLSIAIDYDRSDPVPQRYGLHLTDPVFARWLSSAPKYRIAVRNGKAFVVSEGRDAGSN